MIDLFDLEIRRIIMSKNTEAVHLRMPKELKGKLQIEAALQRRSLADYCRIILEKSINDNSTK